MIGDEQALPATFHRVQSLKIESAVWYGERFAKRASPNYTDKTWTIPKATKKYELYKWGRKDSNSRPSGYESPALTD